MAGSVFQFQGGIIVFRVGYRTVETIRFVVDAGTCIAVDTHMPVPVIIMHRTMRAIDRDTIGIYTQTVAVGIAICE